MLWLKNLQNVPPGEFYFRQGGETPKFFDGSPLIGDTASRLSSFRKANGLSRPGERECLEDIIVFTVNRLPPRSEWVYDTDLPAESLLPSAAIGGCSGCGAKL